MNLKQADTGKEYRIVQLPHLPILKGTGLKEGERISLVTVSPFQGPYIICKKGRHYAISREICELIRLEEE